MSFVNYNEAKRSAILEKDGFILLNKWKANLDDKVAYADFFSFAVGAGKSTFLIELLSHNIELYNENIHVKKAVNNAIIRIMSHNKNYVAPEYYHLKGLVKMAEVNEEFVNNNGVGVEFAFKKNQDKYQQIGKLAKEREFLQGLSAKICDVRAKKVEEEHALYKRELKETGIPTLFESACLRYRYRATRQACLSDNVADEAKASLLEKRFGVGLESIVNKDFEHELWIQSKNYPDYDLFYYYGELSGNSQAFQNANALGDEISDLGKKAISDGMASLLSVEGRTIN